MEYAQYEPADVAWTQLIQAARQFAASSGRDRQPLEASFRAVKTAVLTLGGTLVAAGKAEEARSLQTLVTGLSPAVADTIAAKVALDDFRPDSKGRTFAGPFLLATALSSKADALKASINAAYEQFISACLQINFGSTPVAA